MKPYPTHRRCQVKTARTQKDSEKRISDRLLVSPMDTAKRTVFMCHNQRRSLVGKARYSGQPKIAIIFSQCQDLLTSFAQIIILVGRGAYIGFKHRPSYSVFTTFFSFKPQTILQTPETSGYHSIQSFKHKSTQSSRAA